MIPRRLGTGLSPAIAAAMALAISGSAVAATMTWEDELCTNVITYDKAKTDEQALRNSVNLLFSGAVSPPSPPLMFEPEQVARADPGKLQAQCAEAGRKGRALKLLPLPGLEEFRAAVLADLEDSCKFYGATIRAVKDASALREYQPALPACAPYVDALEGKADFERLWRDSVERDCANNASPAACRNRFFGDAQKADGPLRKRLFVLNFGWNNCAVEFMRVNAQSKQRTAMRNDLEKRLRRQFKVSKRNCQKGD
jgi:hypothetical protein